MSARRRQDVVLRPGVIALLAALLLPAAGAQAFHRELFGDESSHSEKWGYEGELGPEHWGDLSSDFAACKNGTRQSPIDIRSGRLARLSPLAFHYRSSMLSVVNDGRSIAVDYAAGGFVRFEGQRYELQAIRFHSPSEHRVQGVAADMVAHLIHKDARGRVAIVAIPFKAGHRPNSTLEKIWEHMPENPSRYYNRQRGINATFLLPSDRSYFTYEGSLTTPPCTEGVRWFVLQAPLEVDARYIEKFRRVIGRNARPVQPLGNREVLGDSRL